MSNTEFLDGSKFRANASKSNTWDEVRCKKSLEIAEMNIERIMEEAEQIDKEEANAGTLVKLDEELQDQKKISGCINCGKKKRNCLLGISNAIWKPANLCCAAGKRLMPSFPSYQRVSI